LAKIADEGLRLAQLGAQRGAPGLGLGKLVIVAALQPMHAGDGAAVQGAILGGLRAQRDELAPGEGDELEVEGRGGAAGGGDKWREVGGAHAPEGT